MELKYTEEQIKSIINSIDQLETQGIGNMYLLIGMLNVLNSPIKEIQEG